MGAMSVMQRGMVGLAAAMLLWLIQPASADCVSACQAATYCDSEMHASGECASKLNDCYISQCSKPSYGALAYDAQSGASGYSFDFDDQGSAEAKALEGCREDGSDCKVVYDFWNSCAALATASDRRYAVGRADSQVAAQNQAVATCQQETGASCEIQAWSCAKR
jgi:hypothetical protein